MCIQFTATFFALATPRLQRLSGRKVKDGGSLVPGELLFSRRAGQYLLSTHLFRLRKKALITSSKYLKNLEPLAPEKIPEYLLKEPFLSWRHEFRRLQSNSPQPPEQYVWIKANGEVPADRSLQTCLLVL